MTQDQWSPGSERKRSGFPSDAYPRHISDINFENAYYRLRDEDVSAFPFVSWASANEFAYPPAAKDFLSRTGSAAEAFFVREFVSRPGVRCSEMVAQLGPEIAVFLQTPASLYRIDVVVTSYHTALAIEIDGMTFHHRAAEQVTRDYLRERRLVLLGFTVIRFTAQEVFANAAECARQADAIMEARRVSFQGPRPEGARPVDSTSHHLPPDSVR